MASFAEYCDSCYLMIDFDPDQEGQKGRLSATFMTLMKIIYVAKVYGAD